MLHRATRQLCRVVVNPVQARAFASKPKKDQAKDDHHDHHGKDDHHHDGHHDHHDHHDHELKTGPHWAEKVKHVPSYLGRRTWISASVGDGIPHSDPANPGYDVMEKRSRSFVGTKLNPQRHFYVNRQYQQQYDDHYFIGDFPEADIIAQSQPSSVYTEQAVRAAFKYLSQKVPGFNLKAEDWEELKGTSWQLHGIDNINTLKYEILDYLADNIVVKESKFRPKVEQRLRKSMARQQMGGICYDGRSLGEFFIHYSTCIWGLKEQSNGFRSRDIVGDYSSLEREAMESDQSTGIRDLEESNDANSNPINQWMRLLHK